MPSDVLPLFRPDVLAHHLVDARGEPHAALASRLARWVALLGTARGAQLKESELLAEFLADVFVEGLGYRPPVARGDAPYHTISREAHVAGAADGEYADAVLGRLGGARDEYVVAVEGKGPRDPLDRPFAGRKMSAVDQGYRYAINLPCDWIVVTNLREIRLYHKGSTQRTYERFVVAEMARSSRELARFVFVLGAERVVPPTGRSHLYALLAESEAAGERLSRAFYADYAAVRRDLLATLRRDNPGVAPEAVLEATQTLLDRALFVAFAEDRGLLPPDTLAAASRHRDPYHPRPIWDNFRGLFRAIDQGSQALGIPRYNGGLFAPVPLLDEQLVVSDTACERFTALGGYDYRVPAEVVADVAAAGADGGAGGAADATPIVDVEILGHIFEQSIGDLESLRASLTEAPAPAGSAARSGGGLTGALSSRRRREGAFYTQRFVTRYLVTRALRPVLDRRFERLRELVQGALRTAAPTRTHWRVLDDPRAYVEEKLNEPQRAALVQFWEGWLGELQTVRVLDPACGSGAFLIEAFDQLHAEYQRATDTLEELRPQGLGLFDPDRTILQENLFGVDLNAEAIDIARLSVWIKTAQRGKVLTDLDQNIRAGNSVVSDPAVDPRAFDWDAAFPAIMGAGGFDVVVGNPPYVRAELLGAYKPHWRERFTTYHGSADLYVYFYELGLRLLRPGGRLAYIVTNKWLKAGYAEALRRYLATDVWLEEVVDLGHARQVFPDADVFPSLLVAEKPGEGTPPPTVQACIIPREVLRTEQLAAQVSTGAYGIPRARFDPSPWMLDPPAASSLMQRMRDVGEPLAEYAVVEPLRGIMTGYNEAFLLTASERDRLVADDPTTAPLFKPYVRGQDVNRWAATWDARWLLVMRSSSDHAWPWCDAGARAEEVFAATYPALHRHMQQHEARLRRRSDQGRYWWELRPCAYYDQFERRKLLYQEIQFYPAYALDTRGLYANNKTFLLPTDDLYLLGVLNSPLLWWHNWRFLGHMKDDALNPAAVRLRELPIARPTDTLRGMIEAHVESLVAGTSEQRDQRAALLDWLRVEFAVETPGDKLRAFDTLTDDAFVAEVKRRRAGAARVSPAELRRLRQAFAEAATPLQGIAYQMAARERAVSDAVMQAYGLTTEEVELVWRTAPPRTPLAAEQEASDSDAQADDAGEALAAGSRP